MPRADQTDAPRHGPPPRRAAGRAALLLALLLAPGCALHAEERVRAFTEDGLHLFELGRYRDACESFEAALEVQPGDPNLLYNIGQCYDRQGKADKAQELYRQCLQRSANHAPCRHALAMLLLRNGKRADAEEMVLEWLAENPTLPDALVEDGWRLRQDGQLEQAMGRFQQALAQDPHHVRALIELGILYEHYQLPERALTLYERALAREPDRADLIQRVNLLKAQGVGKPRPD